MATLFLYNNGPRGDVVFCRAVYRAVAAAGRVDVVLGACRDDAEVLADLAGPGCRLALSDLANTPHGAIVDLGHLRPDGAEAVEVWLGGNEERPSYQWPDIVDSFDLEMRKRGLDLSLAAAGETVPMLDFAGEVGLPPLRRPAIYLDLERGVQKLCHFVFDCERLAEALPWYDLLCTAPPGVDRENLVDVSGLSAVARSRLSDRCEVLVGRTFDPFNLTLTEANRYKPKALCGYDARLHAPYWDYPGNPLELLATMDELVNFLLAHAAAGARP